MKKVINEKKLQSHLHELEGEIQAGERAVADRRKELEEKGRIVSELKKTLETSVLQGKPVVSEHSIIRYIERVVGYDINDIKDDILHEKVLELVNKLGPNGTYPHPDGWSIVIKNNRVVTILSKP